MLTRKDLDDFAALTAQIPVVLTARDDARDAVRLLKSQEIMAPEEPCTWEQWTAYQRTQREHYGEIESAQRAAATTERAVTTLLGVLLDFGMPLSTWILMPDPTYAFRVRNVIETQRELDYAPVWQVKGDARVDSPPQN